MKKMDYFLGTTILVGFYLGGSVLHRAGVPIPGGVLGLLLFYLALSSGLLKTAWVERASTFLLRHMVLLFVPLTVGLMNMGELLSRQWLAIAASLVVSLLAVLLTTALLGRWILPAEQDLQSGAGSAAHGEDR